MTDTPKLRKVATDPANPSPQMIFEELQRRFPRELEIAALSVSNRLYAQQAADDGDKGEGEDLPGS